MAGCRVGRKACARAGLTACRGSGTALAVGRLAVMALLVRAHRVGAIVVDGHIGVFCPAGRALHGAATGCGHQQGNQVEQAATVYPAECGFRLEFDQPQRAPTPGQAVVLYQGDTVLGGGTITRVEK